MKLNRISVKNFRRFKNITTLNLSQNLTALIGENDAGKSSFFGALEIFFSEKPENLISKEDINTENLNSKDSKNMKCEISCSFSGFENEFKGLDVFNKYQEIEICKVFSFADIVNISTYFIVDYSIFFEPIQKLNSQSKMSEIRETIYRQIEFCEIPSPKKLSKKESILSTLKDFVNSKNNDLSECKIGIKQNAKFEQLYNRLDKEMPYFAYFRTDKANTDNEPEMQGPLETAINNSLSDLQQELLRIEDIIINKANESISKLKNTGIKSEILNNLQVEFKEKPKWNKLFNLTYKKDNVAVNFSGSGTRRLLSLISYIHNVQVNNNGNSFLFTIEEPETGQHPKNLVALFNDLIKISENDKNQIIITTHTPEIAKIIDKEDLIFVQKVENQSKICNSDDKLKLIANTLGVLPYLSKVVVCVEGDNDIIFLRNINKNISEYKNIIDLEEDQISIIPMIGSNLINWVNRNYLKNSNIVEVHIYDRDTNSGKNTEKYKKECDKINKRDDNSFCFLTNKREMENYIPKSLIEKEFNIDCGEITDWDTSDIPSCIMQKQQKFKQDVLKKILNDKLSSKITKEHLVDLGAFEEIKGWFEKIKEKIG